MNIIIIEDEIAQVWEYEIILETLGIDRVEVYKDATIAERELISKDVDLIITDILLSKEQNGFDLLEKVKHLDIPFIVITGYPREKYLDKAFELGAEGFFTKPLDKIAFKFFLKNLITRINLKNNSSNFVVLKEGKKINRINQRDIEFVQTEGNYSTVHLLKRKVILKKSLKYFKEILNPDFFSRCHRSSIVNIDFVKSIDIERNELQLKSGSILPLGISYKNKLKLQFMRKN